MSFTPDPNPLGLTPDLLGKIIAMTGDKEVAVTNEHEFNQATMRRDALNGVRKDLGAARERAKRPFINENRRIDGLANVLFDQIKPMVQKLDAARTAFRDACMNPVLTVYVADPATDHPPDLSAMVQEAPAAVPKMRVRTVHALEITNLNLIPRDYFDLNEARLKAALVAGTMVPGAGLVSKEIPL